MRDFKRLQADPPQGVTGTPHEDDIMDWSAVIFGPDDSPWEGGTFQLSLHFSEEYPNKPPTVKFVTKLFHPNVYPNGAICLDILQNQWSPIYDIAAILTSIQSLLTDPNPSSPANVEAAKLYTENRREYDRKVMQLVEESWYDVNLGEGEEEEEAAEAEEEEEETNEDEHGNEDIMEETPEIEPTAGEEATATEVREAGMEISAAEEDMFPPESSENKAPRIEGGQSQDSNNSSGENNERIAVES